MKAKAGRSSHVWPTSQGAAEREHIAQPGRAAVSCRGVVGSNPIMRWGSALSKFGGVVQLVEQGVHCPEVGGSSPPSATNL